MRLKQYPGVILVPGVFMRRILLSLAMSCVLTVPAAAQQLTLTFNNGLVTVDAVAVPVRALLAEWAKKGSTKVVGAERVTGAPLTVKLIDVPEAQALEVVLRSVAGYMAAPRSTGEGASIYDRILVMATSSTPPPSAARPLTPANPNAMAGTQRFVPPQRQQQQQADDDEEEDPTPPNPPVFTFPGAPNQNGQPGALVNQPQGNANPQVMPPMIVNPQTGQTITISPAAPTGYPTPSPFGSGTPGMINQPAVQPGQPVPVTRPPGRQQQ
jgi:hypothetical protein